MKNKSVDKLIDLCKKNNTQAQIEIYDRYHKAMFTSALKIVHHKVDAEDIMQESFLTAFNKLDQYRGDNNFGGWLKKIVIRKSIENYNVKMKEIELKQEIKGNLFVENSENLDFDSEKHKDLISALSNLNPRYRNALSLMYLEGYDYEELVEILNLSYGSCRTLISRAKEQLKKKLSKPEVKILRL